MSEKLKPCPFDGNSELIFSEERDVADGFSHGFIIRCPSCGISMRDEYKSELIEQWNTRPTNSHVSALVEALEGLLAIVATTERRNAKGVGIARAALAAFGSKAKAVGDCAATKSLRAAYGENWPNVILEAVNGSKTND